MLRGPERRRRRIAVGGAVVAMMFVASLARGEEGVTLKLEETQTELGATQEALRSAESDRRDIEARLSVIEAEVGEVRRAMVDAAADAQRLEDELAGLEKELAGLEKSREVRRAALAERRLALGRSVAALQRLARTPPEALLAMPTSLREAHNTTLLIGAVARELDLEAQFLKIELADLDSLEIAIAERRQQAEAAAGALEGRQAELIVLLERKASLQSETEARHARAVADMEELVSQAGSLQELVDELARLQAKAQAARAQQQQQAAAREAARRAAPQTPAAIALSDDEAIVDAASRADGEPAEALREPVEQTPAHDAEGAQAVVVLKVPDDEAVAEERAVSEADEPAETAVAALSPPPAPRDVRRARGTFVTPARGDVVQRYGENTPNGLAAKGIAIETRGGAQVVSPYAGEVVFSGPFRKYGQILIISHGGGYHTLLAGLGQMYARLGQKVVAGEPVGVMAADRGARPRLYVELRQKGRPINPLPWLAAGSGTNRG